MATVGRHQTFFGRLGLADNASPEEVEPAWRRLCDAADGPIEGEVREAYELLREPPNALYYKELLTACDRDIILHFSADGVQDFLAFCAIVGLQPFQRPDYPTDFKVRRDGQALPSWVRHDPVAHRRLLPSSRERWGRLARRFLLFEIFKGRKFVERVYLLLGYLLIVACVVLAVRWTRGRYDAWSSQRAVAEETRALDTVRVAHRAASGHLAETAQLVGVVEREFQDVTQVSLADVRRGRVQRPCELDLAIIRNPDGSVAAAWAELVNGVVPSDELNAAQRSLADIQQRLERGVPGAADQQQLREVDAWAEQQIERLRSQRARIEYIRGTLKADRFEYGNPQSQRSDTP